MDKRLWSIGVVWMSGRKDSMVLELIMLASKSFYVVNDYLVIVFQFKTLMIMCLGQIWWFSAVFGYFLLNDSWAHKVGFQVISCYPWPLGYWVPIQDIDDNVPWPNPIHPWRDGLSQGLTVIHPPGQADSFPKPDGISERKGNNWGFCVRKPIQSTSSGQDIVKVT